MIQSRHARITGAKLAAAHRWASALNESLGGYLFVYQPTYEGPADYELFVQLWSDNACELSEYQYEQLHTEITRPSPTMPDHQSRQSTLHAEERVSPIDRHQCFTGTLPFLNLRFLCLLPESLPTNPRHLKALATAQWSVLQAFEENYNAHVQTKALVQQVTQDFEELTWLRGVSQQIGEADIRSPMLDVATSQLPMLRNVIKSELIALIPEDLIECTSPTDFDRITWTGTPPCGWSDITKFVRRCVERSRASTLVFNVQTVTNLFDDFPDIRNCIVARVEKQGRKYGYLVAINREMEFLGSSPEDFVNIDPNGIQFGTFEAGLLIVLSTVLSSHATNGELFGEQETLLTGVIRAVINAIDAKDAYTCGHSDRVAAYAKSIAEKMGLDALECERIYMSGLLHDVGKIGVPDFILSKPGKLTDEEFDAVKRHPEIGYQILKHLKPLEHVLPGVLYHHEAVNGKGYPYGLVGEAIPLQGRILAVADAYDAMTSDRPYRQGMPSEKAESILRGEAGKTWDEIVVFAMLECIEQGTVVPHSRLKSTLPQHLSQQYSFGSMLSSSPR